MGSSPRRPMGASAFIPPRRPLTRRSAGSSPPFGPASCGCCAQAAYSASRRRATRPIPWPRRHWCWPGSRAPPCRAGVPSALGPRPGARVLQIGRVPGIPWITSTGARQAHLDGFDLHANVAVAADDRAALEQLCRYVLRPPIAQERLSRTADGRILLTLKTEWSDGTTAFLFEPLELLERLAALTPRPRINLVLHHGAFAPHSRWRARVVAYGREPVAPLDTEEPSTAQPAPPAPPPPAASSSDPPREAPVQEPIPEAVDPTSSARPRTWSWPELLRHTFAVDAFPCPPSGGPV